MLWLWHEFQQHLPPPLQPAGHEAGPGRAASVAPGFLEVVLHSDDDCNADDQDDDEAKDSSARSKRTRTALGELLNRQCQRW
jgi:hypothetical protein